ncbi:MULTISPECIES: Gfo/Idh/MocA family oxidoreductase [unclassified Pseudoalteromonas]|uniref:Gfo/Idh/MocA family protein n=1 Tax=unclassified Pseudoalteromonas TaxID=194690 RepID=UPI000C083E5B|nr:MULTISPECIES: Gfo/Idh/MocA family oxidoreductase [unclassified Pseudoalteromonas]MDP2633485.1 Gfo/Idh/MocA family oxidoreductase [Pseudoalteromonas sp. 1_MG-2023]PHN90491.1 alpha-N-acetylgalactosaminidase [Pseudoalteromonas sp. 3D05]
MGDLNRRRFLQSMAAIAATSAALGCTSTTNANSMLKTATQGRSTLGLTVPKMDVVRVGFIGVGERGVGAVKHFCHLDGVEIKAICDTHQAVVDRAVKIVVDKGFKKPDTYGKDDHDYLRMLERKDIDIVIISTPWKWHTPMAVATMESGKHAFVEVPAAVTVEEAWQLVNTSERTQMNCMMLENVCYGRDELMVLNMVRQGIFGELLHGEAAYIHELRWQMKEIDHKTGSWRTPWHAAVDGNLYPTHGLGPVSQYMNINRGDRFDYITSMSSPSLGRAAYAKKEFPADHGRNKLNYVAGDMNTSIIKTVKGRSIMVQHDTTTPRPYSRHNLIQGTNGVFAGFPNRIALEQGGSKSYHEWDYDMADWYNKYDHPLWQKMGAEAERNGGHGGMDFLMFWRIIFCLRNGEPLDQDVYDAAAWSAVFPLSVDSVADRSNSKDFPDFTRGLWQQAKPLGIIS